MLPFCLLPQVPRTLQFGEHPVCPLSSPFAHSLLPAAVLLRSLCLLSPLLQRSLSLQWYALSFALSGAFPYLGHRELVIGGFLLVLYTHLRFLCPRCVIGLVFSCSGLLTIVFLCPSRRFSLILPCPSATSLNFTL